MTKVYTQDNYETELSTPVLSSSWDIVISVAVAPTYSRGFCFIWPASAPEVAYFHNVIWTTLYIAGPNRQNATTHIAWDPVTIRNCAAIINRLEDNSITTHTPEITGMLSLKVLWGEYNVSGTMYTDEDQSFSVLDNTITYFYLRFSDKSVQKWYVRSYITDNTNAEYGQILFTVYTASGRITSIVGTVPKVYVDYNDITHGGTETEIPTLTNSYINTLDPDVIEVWAKIAFFNTWDEVDKQGDIQSLFEHAQAQGYIEPGFVGFTHEQSVSSDEWTITHNLNSESVSVFVLDSTDEILIPDTITRNLNSVVLWFAGHAYAGLAIIGTPSWAQAANTQPSIDFVAWENLLTGKMVRKGISGRDNGINASYIPSPDTTTFDTVSSSKTLYQTFKAQRDTATKVQLYIKKWAAPDTTSLTIELLATTPQTIEWEEYNVPTWAALATGTIASWDISTTPGYEVCEFSVAYESLVPGDFYALKITATGGESVYVWYGQDGLPYETNWFQFVSSLTPIVWDFAYKIQHQDIEAEVPARVYLASAFEEATSKIIWATKEPASALATVRVETHTASSFTGLSDGEDYFLSDIAGEISLDEWTISTPAGRTYSTTSLIIR